MIPDPRFPIPDSRFPIPDSYRDSLSGFFIGILYRDSLSGFFIGIDCTLMAQIELIFTDFFGIKF
jgi:hypothetical protein